MNKTINLYEKNGKIQVKIFHEKVVIDFLVLEKGVSN